MRPVITAAKSLAARQRGCLAMTVDRPADAFGCLQMVRAHAPAQQVISRVEHEMLPEVLELDARAPEQDTQRLAAVGSVGGCGLDDGLATWRDNPVEAFVADFCFKVTVEQIADGVQLILAQAVEPGDIGIYPQAFLLQALQVSPKARGGMGFGPLACMAESARRVSIWVALPAA